ncbi:hypothetical protein L6452_13470 [Arctium lappa]|uniref:Uncharacterized protein n=1 Tax=Arctium lappa TaxID=4217 RepID=A0ACB9CIE6_ARCLA|nr:hypothetical protein L6452_13470 [Arctium lappa]
MEDSNDVGKEVLDVYSDNHDESHNTGGVSDDFFLEDIFSDDSYDDDDDEEEDGEVHVVSNTYLRNRSFLMMQDKEKSPFEEALPV